MNAKEVLILQFVKRVIYTNVEHLLQTHPQYKEICYGGKVLWRHYFRESIGKELIYMLKSRVITDIKSLQSEEKEHVLYMKAYIKEFGYPLQ